MKPIKMVVRLLIVCLIGMMLGTSHMVFGQSTDISPTSGDGMPTWPLPAQPIPYHEPGQPARSGSARYVMNRQNALGEDQTIELHGLDAALANGTMTDPLQGNYRLVGLDKIMFSHYNLDGTNEFNVESYELVSPTLQAIPNSSVNYGNKRFHAIAAGDLNGDFVDEQIAAWVEPSNRHIMMNIGEMPGTYGKTTSAPAIQAYADGSLDVLVRGYDDALWQAHFDGSTWGSWNNDAGGMLLSHPAVVSQTSGSLVVFAIGLDNQVYQQQYNGSWGGWTEVDGEGHFPAVALTMPLPAVSPPAAVRRTGSQLDLFRVGPDNTLWWCHSDDGSTWGSWSNLGGMLASGPGAVALGDGRMQVYALGMDGALWYRMYDSAWGDWLRFETPEGVADNAYPVLTSPATGQVTVYLAGKENRVWKAAFDGTTWGTWNEIPILVPDVDLDLGIGAAVSPGKTHLFTQMDDGSLYYSLNESGWQLLDGLPVSTPATNQFDTGSLSKTLPAEPADDVSENGIIDITTGHFSGDGREQVVIAYEDTTDAIRVKVYDMLDGFKLEKVAEIPIPIPDEEFPRVAAGDVDGDGVDEIGLVSVYVIDPGSSYKLRMRVFQVERGVNGQWTGSLEEVFYQYEIMDDIGDFGRTLHIEAGNISPEPDPFIHNDEFAVICDWNRSNTDVRVYLHLYDHEATDPFRYLTHTRITVSDDRYLHSRYHPGFALAVGNVIKEKEEEEEEKPVYDEIVVTWPRGFDAGDYPDVERDLKVYSFASGTLEELGSWVVDCDEFSRDTFLDTLAVGDLDQDLVDEIVFLNYGKGNDRYTYFWDILEYDEEEDNLSVIYEQQVNITDIARAFNLAIGDFTGEGLRVGPPTYRVQEQMASPVVFLNLPPMHRDIIDGTVLTVDNGATAVHSAGNTTSSSSTTTSTREWSLSTGFEMSAGAAGHQVSTSLDNTYEEDFSKSATYITERSFSDTTMAEFYDQVIYNATKYAVWEYPVFGAEDDNPDQTQTILVVWPLVDTTTQPKTRYGSWCDESFYVPSHEPYNVWSYNPIGAGDPDFADFGTMITSKETAGGSDVSLMMTGTTAEERSASFHNQVSAGMEYSYENELKIPLIGKAFDFSFRAYADGSYGLGNVSTLSTQFTEDSTVGIDFPGSPIPGAYDIIAYMYWAKAGYLAVDYETQPNASAHPWNLYNKPDPAFILPWYGFPDPDDPVLPPCGVDRQHFTHDIELTPAYIQNGEILTMTATVRNFSGQPLSSNLTVRFYLGYPATNNMIGECSIAKSALSRIYGPQQCHTTWEVTDASGEEKIYAKLDPNDVITEMHEGGDAIDNNIGYGILNVGNADYFDPGLQHDRVYQPILYEAAPGIGYDLYLPTEDMTETLRYEVVPTEAPYGLVIVGEPIQILAFHGGSEYPEEGHTFGSTPAGLMVSYRDVDLPSGVNEANLNLYRQDGSEWEIASCQDYDVVRFPDDNRIAVPVCETGTFVLTDGITLDTWPIYLPMTFKSAP